MNARDNGHLIQALYQAYITGDVGAFDYHTADSRWVELGRNKRSGVYRGKQAIIEHGMQLAVLTDGTITTEVKEILPGSEYVAVVEHVRGQRQGRTLDMDCCSVYTMRAGKIAELHVLPFDAAAWDEFWS